MRQHLTAVNAATAISGAEVSGAQVSSTELCFTPGKVQGGDYNFNIGTAGSCTLVLQTVLPALLMAEQESRLVITGGTHNTTNPPFHFLQRAFIPLLKRMGVEVELQLNRFGFYPAGGGEITATIKPNTRLIPLHLESRGERVKAYAESYFAGLPAHIAERELAVVKQRMTWDDGQLLLREINRNQGPGNVLLITLEHEHVTEVFTGFAERGVSAEIVAKNAVSATQEYLVSSATVSTYLADQLLLPMALAGGGSFTTTEWSQHSLTNAEVIQRFLPIIIQVEEADRRFVKITLTSAT